MKGQLNLQNMQARGPTLIGVLLSISLEERGGKGNNLLCKGFLTAWPGRGCSAVS